MVDFAGPKEAHVGGYLWIFINTILWYGYLLIPYYGINKYP